MKKIYKNASVLLLLIFTFLFNKDTKAAKSSTVTGRVNKIRNVLKENVQKGNAIELTEKDFSTNDIKQWGNWGNWNNWNNWAKWNNWGNWGNWRNW